MLTFDGSTLVAANAAILRRWTLADGVLRATELTDRATGRDWIRPGQAGAIVPPGGPGAGPWTAAWSPEADPPPWEEPAERGALTVTAADGRGWRLHLSVPADGPGITCRLELLGGAIAAAGDAGLAEDATGVEGERPAGELPATDLCERLALASRHLDLVAVDLLDQSDGRGTPVQERRFRTYPNERIAVRTCLAALEDTAASGAGLVVVRHAPPPHARAWHAGPDVLCWRGELVLRGHGCAGTGQGWAWTTLVHGGGAAGRAAAMHRLSRNRRRREPAREGRFITNTWGDRNRDGRIAEDFLVGEAAAAAAIGADALQVDDGWQRGVTANSVAAATAAGGGAWGGGFWAADPQFWAEHPARLPRGLDPVAAAAHAAGIDLGLWFAPDGAADFATWERDAEALAGLRARHRVAHWKFDAVKLVGRAGELNLSRLIERLWRDSGGQAWLDLDITAKNRPGFLGADPLGCLFVQNRYSDWGNWWPHETLRTLWELAWWVPPQRLRMEFLNPRRNQDRYAGDPLAPAAYPVDWPMATTLVANPLGWFEASNLPADVAAAIGALARTWRGQRGSLHAGTILPVGTRPGGASTCGFLSRSPDAEHLLAFREPLAPPGPAELALPGGASGAWRLVAGAGGIESSPGGARVTLSSPGWAWWRRG